jgi:hypothetical protein
VAGAETSEQASDCLLQFLPLRFLLRRRRSIPRVVVPLGRISPPSIRLPLRRQGASHGRPWPTRIWPGRTKPAHSGSRSALEVLCCAGQTTGTQLAWFPCAMGAPDASGSGRVTALRSRPTMSGPPAIASIGAAAFSRRCPPVQLTLRSSSSLPSLRHAARSSAAQSSPVEPSRISPRRPGSALSPAHSCLLPPISRAPGPLLPFPLPAPLLSP